MGAKSLSLTCPWLRRACKNLPFLLGNGQVSVKSGWVGNFFSTSIFDLWYFWLPRNYTISFESFDSYLFGDRSPNLSIFFTTSHIGRFIWWACLKRWRTKLSVTSEFYDITLKYDTKMGCITFFLVKIIFFFVEFVMKKLQNTLCSSKLIQIFI